MSAPQRPKPRCRARWRWRFPPRPWPDPWRSPRSPRRRRRWSPRWLRATARMMRRARRRTPGVSAPGGSMAGKGAAAADGKNWRDDFLLRFFWEEMWETHQFPDTVDAWWWLHMAPQKIIQTMRNLKTHVLFTRAIFSFQPLFSGEDFVQPFTKLGNDWLSTRVRCWVRNPAPLQDQKLTWPGPPPNTERMDPRMQVCAAEMGVRPGEQVMRRFWKKDILTIWLD